jgi:hypothetical protein
MHKKSTKFITMIRINNKQVFLGYFNTVEESFFVYKKAKEQQIKKMAEKYKNKITEATYIALMNYKVEIND